MSSDYCCVGMLKGQASGYIVPHQEAPLLAVRLAADDAPVGLQPFLILRYCPSCGRRLDSAPAEASERRSPEPVALFPDLL